MNVFKSFQNIFQIGHSAKSKISKIVMSNERFARLVEIQLECSHKMIVKEVEDHFVPRNELSRIGLRTQRIGQRGHQHLRVFTEIVFELIDCYQKAFQKVRI